jgi:hypothetical protein
VLARGFLDKAEARCRFGAREVPGTFATVAPGDRRFAGADSAVVCAAPAAACRALPCSAPVRVSLNGQPAEFYPAAELPFTWHEPVRLEALDPSAGPAAGGTVVDLRVSPADAEPFSHSNLLACAFASNSSNVTAVVPARRSGPLQASCAVPPGTLGDTLLVHLSLNGGIELSRGPGQPFLFVRTRPRPSE